MNESYFTTARQKAKQYAGIWLPIIIIIAGIATLLVLSAIPKDPPQVVETVIPPVNVSVLKVQPVKNLQETMTHKAVIEPWTQITLSAEISASVVSIDAAEGDMITAGQTIVKLNDDLLSAAYEQARLQAELDQRDADRVVAAAGSSTPSEKDYARSKAAASKAALEHAVTSLSKTKISAPLKIKDPHPNNTDNKTLGRLDHISVEIGEYVQPGQNVAYIIDSAILKVIVNAPERDINFISVGDSAEVIIEALDNKTVTGRVHFIQNIADPETLTYRVEIMIDNPDGKIRPGMFARVTLNRRNISDAMMIPLDAAIPMERDYEVYVYENGIARRRFVYLKGDLIRSNADGVTEILAYPPRRGKGIETGDLLIVRGQRLLADGQKVIIQKDIAE